MGECCDHSGYDETFGDRFARRQARRYRRRGLNGTESLIVGFLADRGLEGASVLEIGATAPDEVAEADVVVLHRVVCCYPDYRRLLSAAGSHARRMLVFSHPPPHPVTRAVMGWDNLARRIRGNDFRSYIHSPEAMLDTLRAQGLTPTYRHRSWSWQVVGLER
jgi:magnesium-protoporphyrin O-methyltransferase